MLPSITELQLRTLELLVQNLREVTHKLIFRITQLQYKHELAKHSFIINKQVTNSFINRIILVNAKVI